MHKIVLLPPHQWSSGKVMFSQVSVILFEGGGAPMWPLPMMHCTSLYNPPSRHGPLRTGIPASDIWWSPLEIYSYSGWLGLLVWNIWHLKYSVIKCAFNKRLNHFILTVADQEFLRWGRQCEREAPTYCLATIFKTAWKWRKLDREGHVSKILLCRSATD